MSHSHPAVTIEENPTPRAEIQQKNQSASATSTDLRSFIDSLSAHELLRRVSEPVDWKFELGEITRSSQMPLLFENVRGYAGHRVFTNGLCSFSAIELALGLSLHQSRQAAIRSIRSKIHTPLSPRMVKDGPVLENVLHGSDIDFLSFPIPQWSTEESGRYLGTWHINVTRDPESRIRNVGVYRMQVISRN